MRAAISTVFSEITTRPHFSALAAGLLCVLVAIGTAAPALAQGGDLRSGRLNPFPKNDIYRLHLVGDWFVDGLKGTLTPALRALPRIQLQSELVELQSLRRSNWDKWVANIRARAAASSIDIAVVMYGATEFGSVFSPGRKRLRLGTDDWRKAYAERVDSVMKALKSANAKVYWIGIPIVRRRDHSESFQQINAILRERAYANSLTFIDTYSRFQDENGGFSRNGPDLTGATKLMRTKDGVYFTAAGYEKLAHLVTQMIRRDLNSVKAERVVSLAGSDTEQRTIQRNQTGQRAARTKTSNRRGRTSPVSGSRFTGEKANDGSVTFETQIDAKPTQVTLKLPRPALSAAIMALMARSRTRGQPAQFGDNAVQVLRGGVPLLSTVTPANQSALALRRRKLSPTQSVFFKVWGKGERLEPKPGRADDFQWPRPEPKPVVHAKAEHASTKRGKLIARRRDPNLPPLPVQRPYQ